TTHDTADRWAFARRCDCRRPGEESPIPPGPEQPRPRRLGSPQRLLVAAAAELLGGRRDDLQGTGLADIPHVELHADHVDGVVILRPAPPPAAPRDHAVAARAGQGS